MTDHDVPEYGRHLQGKNIAVIVTGGIAAYKSPSVIRALRMYGATVVPFMTENSHKFVAEDTLRWASNNDVVTKLTAKSEHLSHDGKEYDGVLVYPATYNFIGKMTSGIADDAPSTLIASTLNSKPVMICPAMHGSMADGYVYRGNMSRLTANNQIIEGACYRLKPKMENGKLNVWDTKTTVSEFVRYLAIKKNKGLAGKKILVTAGPTPTKIDNVRLVTNKFSGKLGIEIANELFLQGANVRLLQSYTGIRPPKYITHTLFNDYAQYKSLVLGSYGNDIAILSAAVADYEPKVTSDGKLPSGKDEMVIEMKKTAKVVDKLIEHQPNLKVVSFKYEEHADDPIGHLKYIASERLEKGHHIVVGNDINLNEDKQKCLIFEKEGSRHTYSTAEGKINIARALSYKLGGVNNNPIGC